MHEAQTQKSIDFSGFHLDSHSYAKLMFQVTQLQPRAIMTRIGTRTYCLMTILALCWQPITTELITNLRTTSTPVTSQAFNLLKISLPPKVQRENTTNSMGTGSLVKKLKTISGGWFGKTTVPPSSCWQKRLRMEERNAPSTGLM